MPNDEPTKTADQSGHVCSTAELEPTAWLVTWPGEKHQYVQAFASELTAVEKARVMGGTCQPMFTLATVRYMLEGAWCAGYYHAGYTHDSAYAEKQAEMCADEFLGSNAKLCGPGREEVR